MKKNILYFYALLACATIAQAMEEDNLPKHQQLILERTWDHGFSQEEQFGHNQLTLSQNGKWLAGGHHPGDGYFNTTKIWDANTHKEVAKIEKDDVVSFMPSNDGTSLFYSEYRSYRWLEGIDKWDIESEKSINVSGISTEDGHPLFVEHPSGNSLIIADRYSGHIFLRDLRRKYNEENTMIKRNRGISSLAYNKDGSKVAILYEDLPCEIIETAHPENLLQRFDLEILPDQQSERLTNIEIAFDDNDALHYCYGYLQPNQKQNNNIIFSKNLATGETSHAIEGVIQHCTFHPATNQFFSCDKTEIAKWEPIAISQAAVSMMQKKKECFLERHPIPEECEPFSKLSKMELKWLKSYIRHLAERSLENLAN